MVDRNGLSELVHRLKLSLGSSIASGNGKVFSSVLSSIKALDVEREKSFGKNWESSSGTGVAKTGIELPMTKTRGRKRMAESQG